MTNADKIRSMTNDELANFLAMGDFDTTIGCDFCKSICPYRVMGECTYDEPPSCAFTDDITTIKYWLETEAK